ncbi:MAG: PASTA domain-containing protein [Eubacterium sp.]|nr:PASTA domain-containing protein [Eubacterium sp.]
MKIGSEWKGWTVTEYLGGGSFGKVYRIVREEFGYKYEAALKVIRIPSTEDEIDTVRLEGMTEDSIDSYFYSVVKDITSELAILSQLSGNSNIVSYEDHSVVQLKDEFGWEIYLRMELVTPLYEHLKGKELTKQEVLKIGIDICKALETCEKNNIIHRDIKPDNIFYSKQGTYKLGDFGIARKLDKSAAGMTKVGTFSYMAPEVYLGQPYDHTVDIYSLGIILYQFMNCNRRPFMPPYPDTISVDDNERANTSRLAGKEMSKPCNADDRFAGIILKACAFEHLDRYQDASELCRDLEALLDDKDADKIVFSGWAFDNTKDIGSSDSTSTDETVTMFESDKSLQLDLREYTQPNEEIVSDNKVKSELHDKTEDLKDNSGISLLLKRILVFIAIVTIISAGLIFWYFNHTVPKLVGKGEEEAIVAIEQSGLNVGTITESEDFSDEIEMGDVLTQSIREGSKVKRGTVIDLEISKGKAVVVPDFTKKMDYAKARKKAEEIGLVMEIAGKKYDDNIKKDRIISQDIAKGQKVKKGQIIKVIKSRGIEQVRVPDVTGKAEEDAKSVIKDSKLNSKIEYEEDNSAVGIVIRQTPDSGKKVDKKSIVTLTVGKAVAQNSTGSSSSTKSGKNDKKDDKKESKDKRPNKPKN